MKRKLIAALLVLAMVLSLCACGSDKKEAAPTEETKEEAAEETKEQEVKEPGHEAGDIVGEWKCVSMTSQDLGTMTSEESEELLGYDMLSMFSFSGWKTGHCILYVEQEDKTAEFVMSWTKEGENYTLAFETPGAEEIYDSAALKFDGETLILTMKLAAVEGEAASSEEVYSFEYVGEPGISVYSFSPEFSTEDVMKMSSYSNNSYVVVADGTAYGQTVEGKLGCAKISKDGSDVVLEDASALLDGEKCQPCSLQYMDGYVYACVNGEKNQGIVKINTKNNEVDFLYDKQSEYVQAYEGKLYFTDENHHYCSMDTDGKNVTTIIDDREIYYPYQVGDDWIVFQDDADGESLHIYHAGEKIEKKITDVRSYSPMICGEYLYFRAKDEKESVYFRIGRVNLRTWETELSEYLNSGILFIEEDVLFMENMMYKLDEWDQDLDPDPDSWEYFYEYSDGEYRVYNLKFECWFAMDQNFGGSSTPFSVE